MTRPETSRPNRRFVPPTTTSYDALNRTSTVTDPRNGVTSYACDAAGNVSSVRDPNGNATTFAYDADNRKTSEIDPLNKHTTYACDVGVMTGTTDALGRKKEFTHDVLDRLTQEVWRNPNGTVNDTKNYVCDAAWTNPHARRLARRLHDYGEVDMRFLDTDGVTRSNNKAEREIHPVVLMRKVSQDSASDQGAATRGVLMSIYYTLKQLGFDPIAETEAALREFVTTGVSRPLPEKISSVG